MTPIRFVSVTEHYTYAECEGLNLKDVVTREGFQGIRLVPTRTKDNKPGEPLVGIQYVRPLFDDEEKEEFIPGDKLPF